MENEKNLNVSYEALAALNTFVQSVMKTGNIPDVSGIDENYVSPFAAYLLQKADKPVVRKNGVLVSKSDLDEVTLDFTSGRTLSEEAAEQTVRFIFDKSPKLALFNSRPVTKLVTPIQGRAITKENLVSNEQNGAAVTTINRRIVHNFGVNLYLKNINLQKDIPLQTVVNNLYNPSFYNDTMSDVATALANDILLLVTNGLEYASYASSENFYDLNRGFVRILQLADGKNTNTYGAVEVVGFLGTHLTPQKVNAVGCTGANYTAANLITLMRDMYKAMLPEYRDDVKNVWMMSQVDADLYMDSRSDMGFGVSGNGSNVTREAVLTGGLLPNFMGKNIVVVPDMIGINETHKYQSSVKGSIIFGNPKNIDVVMSQNDMVKSMDYNARGSLGATYEYDFQGYIDVHVAKPESFVIAFSGATVSAPVVVTEAGSANGLSGEFTIGSTNHYDCAANAKGHVCCDNHGAVIVYSTTSADLDETTAAAAAALAIDGSRGGYVAQNGQLTFAADTYIRAYHPNMTMSAKVTVDQT